MAEKILKKHYETVKVTERGNDFMVEFSGPKNKKKKVNESKDGNEANSIKDEFSVRFNTKNGSILKSMFKKFDNYKDALNYAKSEDDDLSWAIEKNGECVSTGGYGGRVKYHTSWRPNRKSVNESRVYLMEPVGRFRLEVWVPGSGGDDDRERFIMASNNLQDIIDRAYDMDLDHDEAFYLSDTKGIYPYDLDQCYDAEELETAIYKQWHYEPSADMRKYLGKMLLPQKESLNESTRKNIISEVRIDDSKVNSPEFLSKVTNVLGPNETYGGPILKIKDFTLVFDTYILDDSVDSNIGCKFKALVDGDFDSDYAHAQWVLFDLSNENNMKFQAWWEEDDSESTVASDFAGMWYKDVSSEIIDAFISMSDDNILYISEEVEGALYDYCNNKYYESLSESMTYLDTDGYLADKGEKYTMSQLRKMWQDRKDTDPTMKSFDSFEKWAGETISHMDAVEGTNK
jgi:hypothetical protein